jgi:hypothetical protein
MQIEKLERIGRLILWLAIASLCVTIPVRMHLQAREASRLAEETKAELAREKADAAKRAAEEALKPQRLSLDSMGSAFSVLDGSTGHLWFSNASARDGVLCIVGIASKNGASTKSLTTCKKVEPYETNIKLSVMFAGGDLRAICPDSSCKFQVEDAGSTPTAQPKAVAAQ